ncbi:TetR/AcrR family transcriptional regulator [Fodinicola feengrottensis]|uniref:TetR/AcrR family transcriptional regulator n=1 Tax=Fodinicola feengrottensis TaxID=435914 RepID=UPI0024428235|nr:TetR/AcrR family transcriptional regulator C-terminal domain-containing protein [Fodinicola feengrottensis]
MAILKSDGLAAVSMRRVATALDTGAGSLYVYVSGRDALLQAMQDRVIATIELETPNSSRWRTQLHSLLGRMRHALLAHPGIAAAAMGSPPRTEASLRLLENLLGILLAGDIEPQRAVWATDVLAALVSHAAVEDDLRRGAGQEWVGELRQTFADLPSDRFPLISTHAAQLTAGNSDERFRFAVDVVVDGLLAGANPA